MEVTYLRLDPRQPETDIFNKYISQQIVYSRHRDNLFGENR